MPTLTPRPRLVFAGLLGYLFGTAPTADVVASAVARRTSVADRDLRSEGSGNPGATNVAKLFGLPAGAAVLAGDTAKAFAACRLALRIAGPAGANIAGTAAVIGHCYPVWNGFRGGKGVAASAGQMLGTFPAYLPVDVALAAVMARTERWKDRPTESTAAVCALWVALATVWWKRGLPNGWAPPATGGLPLAAAASSAVIVRKFIVQPDMSRDSDEGCDTRPAPDKSRSPTSDEGKPQS